LTPDFIRQGFQRHAAMAQLHRWYLIYEEKMTGIANQLDILAGDVTVKSGLGEVTGHAAYAARVAQLPAAWENAHHVKSADCAIAADGGIALKADITYLNRGMLPDGEVRRAELTYTTHLMPTDSVLPRFSKIDIAKNSESKAAAIKSEYAENRLLSLVHYWLALIEDPRRDAEPFREIFADRFQLNFSSGAIASFEDFKSWLAGPGSQVAASTHEISNFSCTTTGPDKFSLSVDFEWEGILPDGKEMTARTRQRWAVENDPAERFARIRTVDVEMLAQFAVKG
jgi:hypothetical protein